jgi:cellulose synthase/poly-beta-1,6-N-acetylglucosamine synthase-like glycosyltransferase
MDNINIVKRYRNELSSVKDLLFYFLVIWTMVLLSLSWLDFFIPKLEVNEALVTSYLILLGMYVVHKETSRWTGIKLTTKPGELFVYIWWISLLAMLLISFFTHLEVSLSIRHLTYEVLGVFLVSEISKNINTYRRLIKSQNKS